MENIKIRNLTKRGRRGGPGPSGPTTSSSCRTGGPGRGSQPGPGREPGREPGAGLERAEIGRASCRERV